MMVSVTLHPGCSPCRTNCSSRSWDKGPTPAPQVGLDKPASAQTGSPAASPTPSLLLTLSLLQFTASRKHKTRAFLEGGEYNRD